MAQASLEPPAPYAPTDAFGVNLATGGVSLSTMPISVGQIGLGGLVYSASFDTGQMGWTHNLWGGIHRQPDNNDDPWLFHTYSVTVLGSGLIARIAL